MVTAGVYMVARLHVHLRALADGHARSSRSSARLTAIFAATIGLAQNDIKKVLAYSTVSPARLHVPRRWASAPSRRGDLPPLHARVLQGLPVPRRRLGDPRAVAASRTCARWAACEAACPIDLRTFVIGDARASPASRRWPASSPRTRSSARCSPPVRRTSTGYGTVYLVLWVLGVAGAFLTAFYMFRLCYMTFHGEFRGTAEQAHHLHESPATMTVPLRDPRGGLGRRRLHRRSPQGRRRSTGLQLLRALPASPIGAVAIERSAAPRAAGRRVACSIADPRSGAGRGAGICLAWRLLLGAGRVETGRSRSPRGPRRSTRPSPTSTTSTRSTTRRSSRARCAGARLVGVRRPGRRRCGQRRRATSRSGPRSSPGCSTSTWSTGGQPVADAYERASRALRPRAGGVVQGTRWSWQWASPDGRRRCARVRMPPCDH